jgi:GalNAc5-diNAcBac-PP-undecaprenol beta-1,3-glucosyltransferase
MKATIILPTHNHPQLIPYALKTAVTQTITDIEIFIIGDGVDDDTRRIVNQWVTNDHRIRFFDYPKAPRLGEILRHDILLQHASGEIVCYLTDDDLWFPNHIDVLYEKLQSANFVASHCMYVKADGSLGAFTANLNQPFYQAMLLKGENRVPLNCVGHTLDLYKALPYGWQTAPNGVPTDLYMWQQFLRHEQCIASSIFEITVVNFPSPWRLNWSADQREEELKYWYDFIMKARDLTTFDALHHFFIQRINSLEMQLNERVEKHILIRLVKYFVKILGIKARLRK